MTKAVEAPHQSVVVNLMGIPVSERPQFFSSLLPAIQDVRARTARPHWLVIDEANHLLRDADRGYRPGFTIPDKV